MQALDDERRLDWLQLIRTPHIGPITFHNLIDRFGSAGEALAVLPDLARESRARKRPVPPSRESVEEEVAAAEALGAEILCSCEPSYPTSLRAIADPPPAIFLRGRRDLLEQQSIAIVGARNASAAGRKFARMLARDCGAAGLTVTSGLARGIDGAAHEAALETGTIAVVAGGADTIYPPEHEALTQAIIEQGALISEAPLGWRATARDFPRRNRLISGLSRGVIVVEAAARSGTLITARMAAEQGREVFAVPGSPLDPRCEGANNLIKDGAELVRSAEDVLTVLAEQRAGAQGDFFSNGAWEEPDAAGDPTPQEAASLKREVENLLSFTPIHRNEILRETAAIAGASPGALADILLELTLSGLAIELDGGRFARAPDED